MRSARPLWLLALSVLAIAGCEPKGVEVVEQTVRVGCGSCQLGIEGHEGCYWAARIAGRDVPIMGEALPRDHDAHGPDGMCSVARDAIVSGRLYGSHLAVTRFVLQPITEEDRRNAAAHDHGHAH